MNVHYECLSRRVLTGCSLSRSGRDLYTGYSWDFFLRQHQTIKQIIIANISTNNIDPKTTAAIDASSSQYSLTSAVIIFWLPATSNTVIVTFVVQHDDVYVALTRFVVPAINGVLTMIPRGFDWILKIPDSWSCAVTSSDHTDWAQLPSDVCQEQRLP